MGNRQALSVLRAFDILDAFKRPDEWLPISDISRKSKLPETTAHRLVAALKAVSALECDERGLYRSNLPSRGRR